MFFVVAVFLLLGFNGGLMADDLLQSTSLQYISFGSVPDLPIADRLLNYRRGSDVIGAEPRIETLNIPKQKCSREASCTFMSNCPILQRVQPQTACEVALNSAGTQILLPGGICCFSSNRSTNLASAVLDDINRQKDADLNAPYTPTRPKSGHLVNFVSVPNKFYGYDKSPLELLPPNDNTKMSYLPGKVPVELPQKTQPGPPNGWTEQAINDQNAQPNRMVPPYFQPSVSTSGQLQPPNQPSMPYQPSQGPPYILPNQPHSFAQPPNTNSFPGPFPPQFQNSPLPGPFGPPAQFQPPQQTFFPNNQPQILQISQPGSFSPDQNVPPPPQPIAQQQYIAYGPNGPYTAFVPQFAPPQTQLIPQMPPQPEQINIPVPFAFNLTQPHILQPVQPQVTLNMSSPTTSSQTFCGVRHGLFSRTARILGGRPSDFGAWPWMAVLLSSNRLRCGATILNEQFLITAAHCVYKNFQYGYYRDLAIRIGLYSMDEEDLGLFGPETVSISRAFIHPFFNATQSSFDVALVQLETPIKFKPHIRPVCLPSGEHLGEMGTVLGWGKRKETDDRSNLPMVLQEVKLPILFPWQCYLQLRSKNIYEEIKPQYICAGGRPNQDACRGDSGGPLLASRGNYWELIGIVSKGYGCGQENVPGFYTNIFFVKDWIESIVASNWNYFRMDPTAAFGLRERSDLPRR
ncbi:hypothetical protein RvY_17868 [Ramazzottius varieornatus]|uniref:Peptidase S1 domain-containing protein n=1 Tax=Ramazzottius varieornatus TaxID=947166 RepID=A0A1D1WA86_RAMVA|nr:hypothetical protein RvY_17868 [Ramazzottius varieornatus]